MHNNILLSLQGCVIVDLLSPLPIILARRRVLGAKRFCSSFSPTQTNGIRSMLTFVKFLPDSCN